MNRRFTKGALLAAAAMTISLASPVAAQADESSSVSATLGQPTAVSSNAAPSGLTRNPADTPSVTRLTVNAGVLTSTGNTYVPARIDYNVPSGWSFGPTARLSANRKAKVETLYDGNYVKIPSAWGAGVYRLDTITFKSYDANPRVHVAPNAVNFRVRQGLYSGGGLRIVRKGSKLTFKVQKVRSFTGTKYVRVKTATVQVKKGKKWKKLKNVKLNKKGNKNFSIKKKGKRKYRLVIKTTNTIQGAKTGAIKI
ncbi:hypothetical protein [Aeromicrobium duanguangcaii]|uniref:Uncharacterized protein n=1 Tax=Aeromicrobium duanguangcaii TaxID=2968086 RepID=A0ABY5KCN5_9ACTN|nr:hypothetical protein [Aeromicrobium duanguangcaii]MCD9155124.1 hypothetical protein [Aeromicrobium duanguangcaii]UUI68222.1 hypothetical protein NP095_13570 [Aeromicrobium duanguangcaii]